MKEHEVSSIKVARALNSRVRKILQNPRKILRKYIKPGMKVLDFGCGPGMFALAMVDLGAEVIAADLQQEMLDMLKGNIVNTRYQKKIKIVKCDKENINIEDKVDFILVFYVAHEVKNKDKMFAQLNKILKDGKKMYIAEPAFHVSKNDFEEELEIAEKQGFRIIKRPKMIVSRAAVLEKKK
jgi:ubiquinone/menaquinone biosynthesis C-methylase UbiE